MRRGANSNFLSQTGFIASPVLVLIAFLFATAPHSQAQVAKICTNGEHFEHRYKPGSAGYERVMEMEWRIHGQVLHFGTDTLQIPVDKELDTLFYRRDLKSRWDTMICNMDQPRTIVFSYNDCCGAFNVCDAGGHRLVQASVEFRMQGKDDRRVFLGMLGEDAVLCQKYPGVALKPNCHSAVVPNIFQISLLEIKVCAADDSSGHEACLYEEGKQDASYEFKYQALREHAKFLYLPVDELPLIVTYDVKKRKVMVE